MNAAERARREDKPPPACDHGNPLCGARPVRFYPCGHRCDEHQPARTRPYFKPTP
ncbi:hypothetical protein [Streptomyces caniscabiei]|uniref:hypothetical protein n=1 Tax=Streptomyces caniscabiei TaxID=2746961 RepID=UPI0029B3F4F5|nr:hypothetical protein [Streptomyces caniscabiei]MDX2986327.1 hypothetical protein [Streptomyces caniscabiei]